jgi:drug/metabolite transporter (DMT)-like permease
VNKQLLNWLTFILLSMIWGSSFILMKIGLENHLTPYQIAALRIVSSGLVLAPMAVVHIRKIPLRQLFLVFLSGTIGSFIPAFLFCIAEEGIDSALAGTLNALTPIFVIITGAFFFKISTPQHKIWGIAVAFTGSILLLLSKAHLGNNKELGYVLFVIFATFLYGINVNMVAKYLHNLGSLTIASVALSLNAIPALAVLIFTGYFQLDLTTTTTLKATGAAVILGVLGTAIASIFFYMLVKRAGGIFASMVTYGIPFVAIFWGVIYNESFGWKQVACLVVILTGVYLANKKQVKLGQISSL